MTDQDRIILNTKEAMCMQQKAADARARGDVVAEKHYTKLAKCHLQTVKYLQNKVA